MNKKIKVDDEYIQTMILLHQTKKYKNVEFHKLRFKEKNIWRTYWYLDEIDVKRLTKPSVVDKRIYNL